MSFSLDELYKNRSINIIPFIGSVIVNGRIYINEIIKDNLLSYDYQLEESGTNLSGGQRQRIILARSLLKSSKIILIDEGLNEIDINLERKIFFTVLLLSFAGQSLSFLLPSRRGGSTRNHFYTYRGYFFCTAVNVPVQSTVFSTPAPSGQV